MVTGGVHLKAHVLRQWGDPKELHLEDIEKPKPQAHEVLVSVKAIGLNPMDSIIRKGLWKYGHLKTPARLGWDIAGVVAAVGDGVAQWHIGDEVAGLVNFPGLYHGWEGRGYAEYVCVPAVQLAKKPTSIPFTTAAALPVAGLTAGQAFAVADVHTQDTVLVHGGAGGVGHILVQLAKAIGANVVATGRMVHHDFLEKLGVDEFIEYSSDSFGKTPRMDVVFDTIGSEAVARSITALRPGGRLVSTRWPEISGPVRDAAEALGLRTEQITIRQIREADSQPITTSTVLVRSDALLLSELLGKIETGQLTINIAKTFAFDDLPQAHEYLDTQSIAGKIVVEL